MNKFSTLFLMLFYQYISFSKSYHPHHHHHSHQGHPTIPTNNKYTLYKVYNPEDSIKNLQRYSHHKRNDSLPDESEWDSSQGEINLTKGRAYVGGWRPANWSDRNGDLVINYTYSEFEEKEEEIPDRFVTSPVLGYLLGWNYQKLSFTTTKYKFCPGDSFLSAFSFMVDSKFYGKLIPEINRIHFMCDKITGVQSHSIYHGDGYSGTYQELQDCDSVSREIAVGYGPHYYKTPHLVCNHKVPRSMRMNCTKRIHQVRRYAPPFDDNNKVNDVTIHRCPVRSALCGFRMRKPKINRQKAKCTLKSKVCCPPQVLSLDFACCKMPSPGKTCDASANWETIGTCHKGVKCTISVSTGTTIGNSTDTMTNKAYDILHENGFEVMADVKVAKVQASAKIGNTFYDGQLIGDILDQTSSTVETFVIDMKECHGSAQQLTVNCGIYDFATKHFKCLPFDEWDRRK